RDDAMAIDVSRSLAALVIDQPADVLRPAAMPRGRADHAMHPLELRNEIPAGPAQLEARFITQALPTVCLDLFHVSRTPIGPGGAHVARTRARVADNARPCLREGASECRTPRRTPRRSPVHREDRCQSRGRHGSRLRSRPRTWRTVLSAPPGRPQSRPHESRTLRTSHPL